MGKIWQRAFPGPIFHAESKYAVCQAAKSSCIEIKTKFSFQKKYSVQTV